MLVELKNGETLNGHLVSCDTYMNLTLKEVIQTSPEGDRFFRLPECYVRGNNVRLHHIQLQKHNQQDADTDYNRSNTWEWKMKSWISSRTNKPVSRPPGEVAEVAKEAEATTTDVEIVVQEEAVAVVAEVVGAVGAHPDQERRKRSKQLKPGPAVTTTAVS
jgi:small nuclear ribonucleoprotein (snRNP)-like protein